MPKRRIAIVIAVVGVSFLFFYLVVRLMFMVELDAAIEQANVHNIGEILANLSPAVVLWLLWAYSFRIGMLLVIFAGGLYSGMGKGGLSLLGAGGGAYLVTCYLPFVEYSARYYGILGTGILILFLSLVWDWAHRRSRLANSPKIASDLRMAGHFFLVMATWSLCGIFGIVTYALQPEIMLARGLQPAAVLLTSHVMAELTLGWFFLFLASRREQAESAADAALSQTGIAGMSNA